MISIQLNVMIVYSFFLFFFDLANACWWQHVFSSYFAVVVVIAITVNVITVSLGHSIVCLMFGWSLGTVRYYRTFNNTKKAYGHIQLMKKKIPIFLWYAMWKMGACMSVCPPLCVYVCDVFVRPIVIYNSLKWGQNFFNFLINARDMISIEMAREYIENRTLANRIEIERKKNVFFLF